MLFLTVLGLLVGGLGAPAYAANTIKGSVTSGGTGLAGITVQLGSVANGVFTQAEGKQTSTAENGTYSFERLEADAKYVVRFASPSNAPTKYLTVTSGEQTVSGTGDITVDQAMVRRPSVSGRVLNSQSVGIQGASVEYGSLRDGDYTQTAGSGAVTTDGTGAFSISDLDIGEYTLRVSKADGPYYPHFYTADGAQGTIDASGAGTFTIADGTDLSGKDVKLTSFKPAALSGEVIGDADVDVTVDLGTVSEGTFTPLTPGIATSAAASTTVKEWAIPDVPSGTYAIRYRATGFSTAYFAGKGQQATTSAAGASLIELKGVNQGGLNSTLTSRPPAGVSGFITSQAGSPLDGVTVTLGTATNGIFTPLTPSKAGQTDTGGGYAIADVPSGTYQVQLTHPAYSTTYYAGDDKAAVAAMPATAPLDTTGAPRTGVNAKLPDAALKGGSVTGTITSSTGAGAGGIVVELVDGSGNVLPTRKAAATARDGSYVISGAAAGSYKVKVTGSRYSGTLLYAGPGLRSSALPTLPPR